LKSQKIFASRRKARSNVRQYQGKLARFKDNTLVNQDYIKDSKLSVANYVKSLDKDLIVGFKRAALG
jgi:translation elongation factor EF-Ts